jgi:branched-chain amino acid transport system substrate-binding protein
MPDVQEHAAQEHAAAVSPRTGRSRRWRVFGGILALLIILAGAGFAWQAVHRPAPIVIAFAASLTGASAYQGQETLAAVRIYLDQVNDAGGVDGHPVVLQSFDDETSPSVAKSNVTAVLNSPAVAVLGNTLSATSVAAGPGYKAGHIAAVTGTALADEVTQDNPYYFRAQSPITAQGAFLADYIRTVLSHNTQFLRAPDIDLVSSEDPYGKSFRAGLIGASRGAPPKTFIVENSSRIEQSAEEVAQQLAKEPEPRLIVIGLASNVIGPMLRAVRKRGIRSLVILASSGAEDNFASQFADDPEEIDTPFFFTENVFAIAPMILDNTGQVGEELAASYLQVTGKRASWSAAGAQDAARVMVAALRHAHVGGTQATRQQDREAVRAALASIDSPAEAVPGNNGPLYFNSAREMPRPLHFGFFHEGRFVSAPVQLVAVQNPDLVDIDHEIALHHIVQIGEEFYWLQRVVYTGIELTRLSGIDVRSGVFSADFYLWMRYSGEDDLPTRIKFSDFSGSFDPAKPLQSRVEDGLNYRLYQVSGTFKTDFDLHDYPFDTQSLTIRLQNQSHPLQEIAYVIDSFGLQLDKPGHNPAASAAFRSLELWHVTAVDPFVETFSVSSTLGEPALFDTSNRVEYAGFDTTIVIKRNVTAFMIKTLIPLFLLGLVVFVTLFFPPTLAKERTTIPVTGILTSAVLLISINNQLPALGYTVALEYVFYVFFALCLMGMVTGFMAEILRTKKFHGHAVAVDLIGQITYGSVVLITVGVLWWIYGGKTF